MTALPFVLLILGWGAIAMLGTKKPSKAELNEVVEVATTGSFSKVRVTDYDAPGAFVTVTIHKSDKNAILASNQIAEEIDWEIRDGELTITIDHESARCYEPSIDICTPTLTQCVTDGNGLSTKIVDFCADSIFVKTGYDAKFENCTFGALLIDDTGNDNITLTNTTIDRLHAYGNHELNFNRSTDSHIGTLAWQPAVGHPNYYVYMNHVNVDNLVWLGNSEGLDNLQINSKGRFNLITKND